MEREETLSTFYFLPRQRELIWLIAAGMIAGLLIPILGHMLSTLFIEPVFCKTASGGLCADVPALGYNIVLCLMSLAVLIVCVREQIFRPALVVLPHIIILWSLPSVLMAATQNLVGFSLLHAAASVLLLTAFYWVVRLRAFVVAAVLWVVLVIVARWILTA